MLLRAGHVRQSPARAIGEAILLVASEPSKRPASVRGQAEAERDPIRSTTMRRSRSTPQILTFAIGERGSSIENELALVAFVSVDAQK